jgi:hypothetical protein
VPWYFAYGSNMQEATFRGRRGIGWTRALAARAPGWRLVLDKLSIVPMAGGVASLVADAEAETFGVLYELGADEMAQVDLSEGVLIGHYQRIEIAVEPLAGGDGPRRAFTLVSDARTPAARPSVRYMALLVEGAEQHGLPAAWIDFLRAVPAVPESEEAAEVRVLADAAMAALRRRS